MSNPISSKLGSISSLFLVPTATANEMETEATLATTSSDWLTERSYEYIAFRGGEDGNFGGGDGSYWHTGVQLTWPEDNNYKFGYLDSTQFDVANHIYPMALDVYAKESLSHLKQNFTLTAKCGSYDYMDGSGAFSNFVDHHILSRNIRVMRHTDGGWHKVRLEFGDGHTGAAVEEKTLFNGHSEESSNNHPYGPYHSRLEMFIIEDSKAVTVIFNVSVYSSITASTFNSSTTNIEASKSNFSFSSYFGANNSNKVSLLCELKGEDLIDITAIDSNTDASSKPKVSGSLSKGVAKGGALAKAFKAIYGKTIQGVLKLLEKSTITISVDLDLAMGIFLQYGYESVDSFLQITKQTYKKSDDIVFEEDKQFSMTFFHEEDPSLGLAGLEINITALGFKTSVHVLTAAQKSQIKAQWDGLESRIQNRILEGTVGIQSVQLIGSASNLDYANDPNDTQNEQLCNDRANALLSYIMSSDVMGNGYNVNRMNALVPDPVENFVYPQEAPANNAERYRFAQLTFILK